MTTPSAKRIVIANTIGFALAIGVSFVQAPFLIHRLGDERYGLWALIGLITGYYGLLDFGTRGAVGLFVARARAAGSAESVATTTATAFWMLVGIAGVIGVLGVGGLFVFPHVFQVPDAMRGQCIAALAIALCTLCLSLPLDVFSAIVAGCRRGEIVSLTETVSRIASMIAIFALLPVVDRLDLLAAINAAGKLIVWLVSFRAARRLDDMWSLRPRWYRRSRQREILGFGVQSFVGNLAGTLIEKVDTVVIATVSGPRFVTYYVIGQSLVTYVVQGVNSITLALTPFFADLHAQDASDRALTMLFTGTRAATLATAMMAGGIFSFGHVFLGLWVGNAYVTGDLLHRSDVVLWLLLAAQVPRLLLSAGQQYLFGTGKQGFFVRVILIEGVANLALSLLFIRPLGLAGVALSTLLPSLVSHGWFMPRYVAKSLGISVRRLLLEGQLRGVICGVAVALIGAGLLLIERPTHWLGFASEVALCLVLVSPVVWRIGLTESDRERARSLLRPLRRSVAAP